MKLSTKIQQSVASFVFALLLVFAFAFLWYCKFPFDIYKDNELSFGAVHVIFNVVVLIFTGVCIILGFVALDNNNKTEINIKKKYILIPTFIIIGLLAFSFISSPFKAMSGMYNKHIEYVNQYEKIEYERISFFDKMWKTYLQKNNICELNKEAFIIVTQIIMDGRHDGEKVSWKWLQENQQIPYEQFTHLYVDLSVFVHEQRDSYYQLEKQAMEIVRQNNTMLDVFPNNIYNKILGIEHMKFEPGFTSSYTNTVFNEKQENLDFIK